MKLFLLIAALILLAAPASAATKVESETLAPLGGHKAAAKAVKEGTAAKKAVPEDDKRTYTPEEQAVLICQTTSLMADNAGAEYKPGVDAYGRAVAPADGGTGAAQHYSIPDRVDIPLDVKVLETLGVSAANSPLDLEGNMGTVSVLKGGQVLFNGKDTTNNVQTYCLTHTERPK